LEVLEIGTAGADIGFRGGSRGGEREGMEHGRGKGDRENGTDGTGHGMGQGEKGSEEGEGKDGEGYSPPPQKKIFLAPPLLICTPIS